MGALRRLGITLGLSAAALALAGTLAPRGLAAQGPKYYTANGSCVAGTYEVPYGVTQVAIDGAGAAGVSGGTLQYGDYTNYGGAGGVGSRVQSTLRVRDDNVSTRKVTLYVGVASSSGPNAIKGGQPTSVGAGGAATWISTAPPGPNCTVSADSLIYVAAGGGGGGTPASRRGQNGGAGGTEANGGTGAQGGSGGYSGSGGGYPSASAGGAGGSGGHSYNCTSGSPGGAGLQFAGGTGGDPGVWGGPTVGFFIPDCSQPPRNSIAGITWGGTGGGGGGGYYGGGGGGGGDDSGYGSGGGGASGRSYAGNSPDTASDAAAPSKTISRWFGDPYLYINPVTTTPAFTSASSATFTLGAGNFGFTFRASGINVPYVYVIGRLPAGISQTSTQFDNGDGAGTAILTGTPSQSGVFPLTASACNLTGCVDQAFTLTINEAPSFTNTSTLLWRAGQAGSTTVSTGGWPRPAITASNVPNWVTFTDNHDGTATLTGTPPANGANTYTIDMTAANGIGSAANASITLPIVTALTITPRMNHLAPVLVGAGGFDPRFYEQQLTATATRPDGSTFDASGVVAWSSSNSSAVLVGRTGLARAAQPGTATITAGTASSGTAATATVVSAVPSSITVTPASPILAVGETQQFTATACYASPCSSNSYDISDHVRWTSNETLTSEGFLTASTWGPAFVEAELYTTAPPSHVSGESDFTVLRGRVTSIDLSPSQATIAKGGEVTIRATAHYSSGQSAPDVLVTWSSRDTSGSGVTFVPSGYTSTTFSFSGRAVGTATITASYTNVGGPTVTATATLKVISVPAGVYVGGSSLPLVKGTSRQYTATAFYNDGSPDVDVTKGVVWTSSNPSVMTVSSDGVVTAVAQREGGQATLTATYGYANTSGGTSQLTGTYFAPITITMLPPVSIAITPTSVPTLHPGDTQQFTAIGTYADGTTADITQKVNWAFYSATGSITSRGLLSIRTGTTQGLGDVQAYYGAVTSNTVRVTVTDPLDHIVIAADQGFPYAGVAAGTTFVGFHADGYDARGNRLGDVSSESTFSISPNGTCNSANRYCVATVAGTHTITATDPNAATPTSTNSLSVTVVRAAADHIAVTGGSATIYANSSTPPYHVTAYDRYGNSGDVTTLSVFRVSPVEGTSGCDGSPGPTPTCHALSIGSHTVTVTYNPGGSDQRSTTVPLWVDPSLTLDHATLSGGPSGASPRTAIGGVTPPYTVNVTDIYGNSGTVRNVHLSITPDGTCDDDALTCTPAGPGTHTVTATTPSDTVSNGLTFTAVAPSSLVLHGGGDWIPAGRDTSAYQVEAYAADSYDLGDVTASSSLTITPDGTCNDTAHTCTADNGGDHTVTAAYSGGQPTATKTLTVAGVDRLEIRGDTSPLRAGETTHPFLIEGYSSDNTDLGNVGPDTKLTIAPDGTCDDATETCTVTAAGAHTITATYQKGSQPTATFDLQVDASPVLAGARIIAPSSIVAGSSTTGLEVHGLDPNGNDQGDQTQFSSLSIAPSGPNAYCDNVLHMCTAALIGHYTITAHLSWNVSTTFDLTVTPASPVRLVLTGGSDSVHTNAATSPYIVHGRDTYGNDTGDVTADTTLSISPDGTCDDNAHTCTPEFPDYFLSVSLNSRHTVTATDGAITGTTTLFANPNQPPDGVSFPFIDDAAYLVNTGSFTLVWPAAHDPEGDPITYTLQRKSTAAGSDWVGVESGLTATSYSFGDGTNPQEQEGTFVYRIVATDGGSQVTSDPSPQAITVDRGAPTTTDDVPSAWLARAGQSGFFEVTLSADDGTSGSGIYGTYYTTGYPDTILDPTSSGVPYDPTHKPSLLDGQIIKYFSVDNAGNAEPIQTSGVIQLDMWAPYTSDDLYPGDWRKQDRQVTLYPTDQQTDHESGVAATYYEIGDNPPDPTTSSPVYDPNNKPVLSNGQVIKYFSVDNAGNNEADVAAGGAGVHTSAPAQIDKVAPTTTSDVPASFDSPWPVGLTATDTGGSGLAIFPPGSPSGISYKLITSSLDLQALRRNGFWNGQQLPYDPNAPPVLQPGWRIAYAARDNANNQEAYHLAPALASQTVSFDAAPPTGMKVGDSIPMPTATASPDPSLPVRVAPAFSAVPPCGGFFTPLGVRLVMRHAGTCTLNATQDGNDVYDTAGASESFVIAKGPQTVAFTSTAPGSAKVGDTYTPAGTVTRPGTLPSPTSALPKSAFGAIGPACSYDAVTGKVTVLRAGTCTVTADQAATSDYEAAAKATQAFATAKGSQTVTFTSTAPAVARIGDTYTPTATASSGLDVALGTQGGSCTYHWDTGKVTMDQPGTCTVTADQAGNSAYDPAPRQRQVIAIADPPGAVADLQAVGGIRSAGLTWSAPSDTGGAAITSYVLTTNGGGLTTTRKLDARAVCDSGGGCSFTVTGLANGTTYDLSVAGHTVGGDGPAATAQASTPALPGAPQGFSAVAGDGQASLGWSPPASDGGSPVTHYQLTLYAGGSLLQTTDVDPASCSPACAYTLTGLTNGVQYVLFLKAISAVGPSAGIRASLAPATAPGVPRGLQASAGAGSFTLAWDPPAENGGFAVDSYALTATGGASTISRTLTASKVCGTGGCAFTLTGLPGGVTFSISLTAHTSAGTGPAASTQATTLFLPSAPQTFTALYGDRQASLTWTPPASDGGAPVTSYRLQTLVGGSPERTVAIDASGCAATCSYTLTGLTNGTQYVLNLSAVTAAGPGPSARTSVVPLAPPASPANLQATGGAHSVTVVWNPPLDTGGGTIDSYQLTATGGGTTITKGLTAVKVCTGSSCTFTLGGLPNGTSYSVSLAARNAAGTGPAATAQATTASLPLQPESFALTAGDGSATVAWAPPASDGGSPLTGYTLRVYNGPTLLSTAVLPLSVCTGQACSYTATGLANGTQYTLYLNAVNAVGNSPSVRGTVTPHA